MSDLRARPRIVILGGGFGGAYAAQALERHLAPADADIVLIDRHNYFVFYPLLVEAGTGSLHPRDAVVSTRSFLRRGRFRMAEVTAIDTARRVVHYDVAHAEPDGVLGYDHLVVALGSVTKLPPVPGLAAFGHEMKSMNDAVGLRDRAIRLLEAADATEDPARRRALLHFVVVGANFTGVELAGEYFVFLREAAARYRNIDPRDCRLTLIEVTDRVLSALDPELGRYAWEKLRDRGIDVRLRTSVKEIHAAEVLLSTGEVLPSATVIWCAGIAPPPLLETSGLPRDARGWIRCERTLRVSGFEDVWAIGDNAFVPDEEGSPHSATAQTAVQQAEHLARNIARALAGAPLEPFRFDNRGALAALGCRTGVAKVFGIKLSGFAAWFLWRTVYLMKMPGLARKMRVAVDWTVDLLFGREFVQLGLRPDREPSAPREAVPSGAAPPNVASK